MEFEGGEIQGFSYGEFSPLDIPGMKIWLRSTDGIRFNVGSTINRWDDISGNENYFLYDPTSQYSFLTNTPNGLAVTGNSSHNNGMKCVNDTAHHFMLDGSPYMIFHVYKTRVGTGNFAGGLALNPTNQYLFFIIEGGGIISLTNNSIAEQALYQTADIDSTAIFILAQINYGYLSGNDYDAAIMLNGNIIDSSKITYTHAPSVGDAAALSFSYSDNIFHYESIIYDNTGKTFAQVNEEIPKLFNILNKRYNAY